MSTDARTSPHAGFGHGRYGPAIAMPATRTARGCPDCGGCDHQSARLLDGQIVLDGGRLVRRPTPEELAGHTPTPTPGDAP